MGEEREEVNRRMQDEYEMPFDAREEGACAADERRGRFVLQRADRMLHALTMSGNLPMKSGDWTPLVAYQSQAKSPPA